MQAKKILLIIFTLAPLLILSVLAGDNDFDANEERLIYQNRDLDW